MVQTDDMFMFCWGLPHAYGLHGRCLLVIPYSRKSSITLRFVFPVRNLSFLCTSLSSSWIQIGRRCCTTALQVSPPSRPVFLRVASVRVAARVTNSGWQGWWPRCCELQPSVLRAVTTDAASCGVHQHCDNGHQCSLLASNLLQAYCERQDVRCCYNVCG